MRTQEKAIAITPSYQWLFVIGVLGGWLAGVALLAHQMASGYTNAGTWIFQASTWVFPVLVFIASLGFASNRYKPWLHRFFFSTMLATIILSVYAVIGWLDTEWYDTIYTRHHPIRANASYWQTFGNTWIVMAATLAAYIGFLLWVKGKKA